MKKKIVGIFVLALFIATAVLPAVGTMNENIYSIKNTYLQPIVEWKKTFDRGQFDYFHVVRQTSDGGYITSGATEENKMYYVWLLKVDANGNEEWRVVNHDLNGTVMGTTISVTGADVHQTSDGGYIVCGTSYLPFDINDEQYWDFTAFLWKTNATGNTQWLKHYYEQTDEYVTLYCLYNVIELENGFIGSSYKVNMNSTTKIYNDTNALMMKTDSSGIKQWEREFDKGGNDSLSSISKTSDGGYFLSGFTDAMTQGALWMVKTDADGNKQWDTLFDGPKFEYTYGKGGFQTSDGGYVMDGVTQSYGHGGMDVWLIKADPSGNKLWDNTFGGTRNDYCWSMCNADNDGFALGIAKNYGYTAGNMEDIYIVEIDKNGNTEWELQLEEAGHQITRFISPTTDGGYIVSGFINDSIGGTKADALLLKIGSFDNAQPSKPTINGKHKGKPNTNYSFTASSNDPDGDTLSYMWDWGDGNHSQWLATPTASYSWNTEDKFEIKVMVKDEHGYESSWSDPFKFSTPRTRTMILYSLLLKVLERFPLLESILNFQ